MVRLATTTTETPILQSLVTHHNNNSNINSNNNNNHLLVSSHLLSPVTPQQNVAITTNAPISITPGDAIVSSRSNIASNTQSLSQTIQPQSSNENSQGTNGPVFVASAFANDFYPPEFYIQHDLCATHTPICTLHSDYGKKLILQIHCKNYSHFSNDK